MIQFQENKPTDIRMEGRTDPISWKPSGYTVDWHLKFKYIEYDVSLTKNYCLTVIMQKIS